MNIQEYLENQPAKISDELPPRAFPCEKPAYQQIDKLKANEDIPYPEIDIGFLRKTITKKIQIPEKIFRRKVEFPAFAVFKVFNNGPCVIRYTGTNGDYWSLYISEPEGIPHKMQETIGEAIKTIWNRLSVNFTTYFTGIIPQTTRDKITEATKTFREDNIYLIAERLPEDWNVKVIPLRDPLVVAYHGDSQRFYLIDSFDPTPIETYIIREFTQ